MKVSVLKKAMRSGAVAIAAVTALMLIGCGSDVVISKPGVYLIERDGKAKVVLLADGANPAVDVGEVEVLRHYSGAAMYQVTTQRCGIYKWIVMAGQAINMDGDGVVKDANCPIDTVKLDNSPFSVIHGDPERVVIKR